jgi:hypothetical protein
MPGVSDLDFRTIFCQSVLVRWEDTQGNRLREENYWYIDVKLSV